MSLITGIKSVGRSVLGFCSEHSPEILIGVGIVAFGATVYAAVKESKKQDGITDQFEEERDEIKTDRATLEDFSDWEYKKELTGAYLRYAGRTVVNYGPAIGFAALSIGCFLSSYGIMKKRNLALLAAYNAVSEAFKEYRARVVEKEGSDADLYYMTGQKLKSITVTDENGEKHKEKIMTDGDVKGLYSFKFSKYKENGERNRQWSDADPIFNDMYLRGMQNELNDRLWMRTLFADDGRVLQPGHVFLNEIRDLLGEDHNRVGSVVGNLYSPKSKEGCDGYINFNMVKGEEVDPETGEMIDFWWITPNVDGVIYDLLDQWRKTKVLPPKDPEKEYLMDRTIPAVQVF